MFFSWRGIIIGLAIVLLLSIGGFARKVYVYLAPADPFSAAVLAAKNCGGSNPTICAQPAVKEMLRFRSSANVMDVLSKRLTSQACHYVGHVVGQQTYKKYKDVETAISSCNRACDSACVHGIIGQAFTDALGFSSADSTSLDFKHLSPSEILAVGKKLCTSLGTCHGVGHALFQAYQEFAPAFDVCEKVAGSMVAQCDNGVTMEYADAISSRSMNIVADVAPPALEALDTLCDFPSVQQMHACYRYFPRIAITVLEAHGTPKTEALDRVKQICSSKKGFGFRAACFGGIGVHLAYLILSDAPAAVGSCENLGSEQAEGACILGTLGVATEDRSVPLSSYCAAMTKDTMKNICYQGLFFYLVRAGISQQYVAGLCKNDDSACQQGLQNDTVDPIQKVRNLSTRS